MNFPVFGDAEANSIGGQACAAMLESGASLLSCTDRDPLGKIAYFALPYRLSKDPAVINHMTLGLKILVFLLLVVAAAHILRILSETDGSVGFTGFQLNAGVTAISVLLLAISLNNIPVRLTDIEAACCAMIAMCFALTALRDATERKIVSVLCIFLTYLFMDFAGLFKQSFFARELLLMAAFSLCLKLSIFVRFITDWRIYAVIALANLGVCFQLYYVWLRFGVFGLTTPGAMSEAARVRYFPIVGLELHTLPLNDALIISVPTDLSRISWFFYKIYYALVTTDPFVYGGFAKPTGHIVSTEPSYFILVYATVVAFCALMIASIKYGSRVVRFVTLVALFNLLFMTAYQHVEPRYHILPKALLVILAVYWTLRTWNVRSSVRSTARPSLTGLLASDRAAARQTANANEMSGKCS